MSKGWLENACESEAVLDSSHSRTQSPPWPSLQFISVLLSHHSWTEGGKVEFWGPTCPSDPVRLWVTLEELPCACNTFSCQPCSCNLWKDGAAHPLAVVQPTKIHRVEDTETRAPELRLTRTTTNASVLWLQKKEKLKCKTKMELLDNTVRSCHRSVRTSKLFPLK